MTNDCRPAHDSLALANAALTRGDHVRAIRLYAGALIRQPALRDQLCFNLALARRRYRASRRGQLPRIGVCGYSLGTNAASRARTLADIYQGLAPTEIFGSLFPESGSDLWPPIRNSVRPSLFFRVASDARFAAQAMELVRNNPYDMVHLSRPRFPNILFGLLYKLLWDARVVIDIDDDEDELAFLDADNNLDLEAYLQTHGGLPALQGITDQEWTRLGIGLRDIFDGVTTSNVALQRRYGGIIVPHARDAAVFSPSPERKTASRARFGVPVDKTVALFFARAKAHKVLLSTARALGKLERDDLWLVIAGDRPTGKRRDDLEAISGVHLHFVGIPVHDAIPDLVAMGDLCLLMPDEGSLAAQYQVPAKLTDALAMGLVTFSLPAEPLEDFFSQGAVVPTSQKDLQKSVRSHLNSFENMSTARRAARSYFLAALSTDACRDVLKNTVFETPALPALGPRILTDHRQQRLFEALGGWHAFADRRTIVYSVLVGDYEQVKEPTVLDANVRYILFTDNPEVKSDKWEVVPFDTLGLSPRRASRLPKLLPHRYLPDHDVSIYIDASLTIVERDVTGMAHDCLQGYDIAAYPHFRRDCLYKEIEECVRLGKADETSANALIQRLTKEQYPKDLGLVENAFLVRRDTPVTRRINELWCSEYLSGDDRDQFYLMYVLWRADVPHAVIANSRDFRKSPHVRFKKHLGPFAPTEVESGGAHTQRLGFLKNRNGTKLKAACEKLLASAPDPETLLALGSGDPSEPNASPLDALIHAIIDLDYQRMPDGHHYRWQLSSRLFPNGGSVEPGHTKIACLASRPMPSLDAGSLHMMKMCSAFAGVGADVVLYAPHAVEGGISGDVDAIYNEFAVTSRFPLRFVENTAHGSLYVYWQLVRQAIEEGCTHVFSRSLDAAVFSVAADVPTILELNAPVEPHMLHKLEFIARSPAFEKLIVTSKSLIDPFKGILRGLAEKTIVLHSGSDPLMERLPALGLDRSKGAIAHIGYVGGHQGSARDVEMCFELAQRLPQVDFHVLGGTAQDINCWTARAAGVPNVKVYGQRPPKEVASFIQEVDITLAPFQRTLGVNAAPPTDSPLEIFDFMAQGKAIVSSDLPVLREVLNDRDNALLCNPDDIDAFTAAVEELSTNVELRRRLGAAARTALVASFTREMRARHILGLIETRPRIERESGGLSPERPNTRASSGPASTPKHPASASARKSESAA